MSIVARQVVEKRCFVYCGPERCDCTKNIENPYSDPKNVKEYWDHYYKEYLPADIKSAHALIRRLREKLGTD